MLRSRSDYEGARQRLKDEAVNISVLEMKLRRMRWRDDEIDRAMKPRLAAQKDLSRKLEAYEGRIVEDGQGGEDGRRVGRTMRALREALGFSRTELASALGLPEWQVEREEDNEYGSLSRATAKRLLDTVRAIEAQANGIRVLEAASLLGRRFRMET